MMASTALAQVVDLASSTIGVVLLTLAAYWVVTGCYMLMRLYVRKRRERKEGPLTRA